MKGSNSRVAQGRRHGTRAGRGAVGAQGSAFEQWGRHKELHGRGILPAGQLAALQLARTQPHGLLYEGKGFGAQRRHVLAPCARSRGCLKGWKQRYPSAAERRCARRRRLLRLQRMRGRHSRASGRTRCIWLILVANTDVSVCSRNARAADDLALVKARDLPVVR